MNNGSFNGFDPNRSGQGSGFMGGYDPNAAPQGQPYNSNAYPPNNGYQQPYNSNSYPQGSGYQQPYNSNSYPQNSSYQQPYNGNSYPQDNGYQQPYHNTSTSGYAPYQGGTYGHPAPQQNYRTDYAAPYAPTPEQPTTSRGFGIPVTGSSSGTMTLSDYSKKIFLWMGAGLALTFFVALGMMLWMTSGGEYDLGEKFNNFLPLFFGGMIAEIVLAIVLGLFVQKMPYGVGLTMFIVYSIVSGITFTPILVVYDAGSAIFAFAAAAILFIAFAIYGLVTKRDLLRLGPILAISLVVLLIFTALAALFRMSGLSIIVSVIGIVIFIGLTAYDTQKIKASYEQYSGNPEMLKKFSINMALQLYLDFINLFLYLLRLMGKARR